MNVKGKALKSFVKGGRGRNFFSHRMRRSRFSYVEFTRLREMDSRDKVFPLQEIRKIYWKYSSFPRSINVKCV